MTIYQIYLKLKKKLKIEYSSLNIHYDKDDKTIYISDRHYYDAINIRYYDNEKIYMESREQYIELELKNNDNDIDEIIRETENIFGELIHGSKDYYINNNLDVW